MMALNSGSGAADSSTRSANMISSKGHPAASLRRRRSSKGTIAGFALRDKATAPTPTTPDPPNGSESSHPPKDAAGSSITSSKEKQQPQHHAGGEASAPAKPCHAARLAFMCCQNAIRMGARTQLGLCPPGRARRGLKAALRQKSRNNQRSSRRTAVVPQLLGDTGGYFGVDKMLGADTLEDYPAQEEDFLVTTNTFDVESDEEASSGDEDVLTDVEQLLKEDAPELDDEKKYVNLGEPLFTPTGAENALGNSAGGQGSGGTGKLPFNRRKLRYFDSVSALDRMAARKYLQVESRRSKQREVMLLSRHLKRMQRQERKRLKQERGEPLDDTDLSDQEADDPKERALLNAGVSRFEDLMTPSMSAAFLIESLSLNPLESIEGMSKCYDGIVAAGVALLESNVMNDPTTPSDGDEGSLRNRSQIMAALTPLLITSLEQPSGEVILCLARLRRMCGTVRYQRRFVQRIAPSLIRPPSAAMWCLKHQNDMEPILAAAELIFDSAFEIFSKGWYDRGQLLLADSKRAETLNSAAMQLRNLSTRPSESLTLGGFAGHGTWRSSKYQSSHSKDAAKGSNDVLAEWEVIAVDRQIRISISNIISMDWSRVVVNSRDTDMTKSYHRSRSSAKRAGVLMASSSGDMSPKAVLSSPLSPTRQSNVKSPVSPAGPSQPPASTQQDNSFPTNFSSNIDPPSSERAHSPLPPSAQTTPLSPPAPHRSGADDDQFTTPSNLFPPAGLTPPRSPTPKSPKRDFLELPNTVQTMTPPSMSPMSPRMRAKHSNNQVKESISNQSVFHPMSPSSVGASPDAAPFRPMSSASSIASSITGTIGTTQPAHYRTLTSTAAERKRTVAACRALRAQITRFEDAFFQIHGRPPKGASERAPLATTYAQYREWKRAIRADAACRIQALFRGARSRWILLRSNNPQMSKVVMSRAGRRSFVANTERLQQANQDSLVNQLSIPAEIGQPEREGSNAVVSGITDSDGFITQNSRGSGKSLPPQWGSNIVRPRPGSNDGFPVSPVIKPLSSPSSSVSSQNSEFSRLSISELHARKRELKQQLKQYDMSFARRHGRMPVKAEKEPIRHLYEKYNALKSQITNMEQEGRRTPALSQTSSSTVLSQRTVSPVGSDSEDSPIGMRKMKQSPKITQSAGNSAKELDLASLKAEKGRLHQMLRSYEKDFFKEQKRQVSSFADIRPVAQQYRRYKEIKKAIATLQDR